MGLFEHFPYTNFHNLNLDWIIEKIKKLTTKTEQLENTINGLGADLKTPIQRVVLIGDDYLTQSATLNFGQIFARKTGLSGINFYSFAQAGAGFSPQNATTFNSILTENFNSVEFPDSITDILVVGGINDCEVGESVSAGIANFVELTKTLFPNAKIRIGFVARGANVTTANQRNFYNTYLLYKNQTECNYLSGIEYACRRIELFNNNIPIEEGQALIGNALANIFAGNGTIVDDKIVNPGLSQLPGLTVQCLGEWSALYVQSAGATIQGFSREAVDSQQEIPVGTLQNGCFATMAHIDGKTRYTTEGTATVSVDTGTFTTEFLKYRFSVEDNNKLYITTNGIANENFEDDNIEFWNATLLFPTMQC